jgi:hypothetical protein
MSQSMQYIPTISIAQKRLNFVLITSVLIGAAIALFLFDPATSKLYPPSPFRALTGLYCPGCGTLRALHQLLRGHFIAAFGLNPLMVISLPFMVYSYCSYGLEAIRGRSLPKIFISARWIWFILQAIIAYWIVRNIPVAPFSWLAP